MLPRDLKSEQFAGYPPEARKLVVGHVATLQRLPLAYLPSLLREVVEYDFKFPAERKALEKELSALKSKLNAAAGGDLLSKVVEKDGVKILAAEIEGADAKALREMVDQLKNKLGSGVVLLGSKSADGKVALCAGVTADLVGKFKAGDIVGKAAAVVGGKGGGRPDMAMAGGTDGSRLAEALNTIS